MSETTDVVGEIMHAPVIVVDSEDPLRVAVERMVTNGVGSVLVEHAGQVDGIFTERDFLRESLVGDDVMERPVGAVASRPVITASTSTETAEAFSIMTSSRIRRLPILDGDMLVGIVTERDLLGWVDKVSKE